MLAIPLQTVVWTLRTPQFTGQEIFTMGGEGRFIQALRFDPPGGSVSSSSPPADKEAGRQHPSGLRLVK
jgi:hypothetical protein